MTTCAGRAHPRRGGPGGGRAGAGEPRHGGQSRPGARGPSRLAPAAGRGREDGRIARHASRPASPASPSSARQRPRSSEAAFASDLLDHRLDQVGAAEPGLSAAPTRSASAARGVVLLPGPEPARSRRKAAWASRSLPMSARQAASSTRPAGSHAGQPVLDPAPGAHLVARPVGDQGGLVAVLRVVLGKGVAQDLQRVVGAARAHQVRASRRRAPGTRSGTWRRSTASRRPRASAASAGRSSASRSATSASSGHLLLGQARPLRPGRADPAQMDLVARLRQHRREGPPGAAERAVAGRRQGRAPHRGG